MLPVHRAGVSLYYFSPQITAETAAGAPLRQAGWRAVEQECLFFPAETGETGQKGDSETIDGILAMTYPTHLIPTTVVGSYPQPDWLIDRAALEHHGVPRVHAHEIWRIPDPYLGQAQDDATILAIAELERAGIDIVSDGEIRRESYSNYFGLSLDGLDTE